MDEAKQKSTNVVKDTLFRTLFSEKERAIELCNALEGTNYPPDADAMICDLDNSLVRRYNDSALAVEKKLLVFSEQQSRINLNMPLRFLSYTADTLYSWFVDMKKIHQRKVFKIPTPKFYVLYNGTEKLEHDVLRLSDAFQVEGGEFSLELTAKVLNVNHGSGCEALEKSPSLGGYAYLVDLIRRYQESGLSRDKSIKPAIQQCISEGILADFLTENFKEVADMLAYEYTFEDEFEANREEGKEIGIELGREEGKEIGSAKKLLELIQKKLQKNKTRHQIIDELELEGDDLLLLDSMGI